MTQRIQTGDLVHKPGGYKFVGHVRSVFTNAKGETRYVVEMEATPGGLGSGMLHIFNESQLALGPDPAADPAPTEDAVVNRVIKELTARSQTGVKKYGTTLETNPASVEVRLQHLKEELMDATNYCEWLRQGVLGSKQARVALEIANYVTDIRIGAKSSRIPVEQLAKWAQDLAHPTGNVK